MRIDAARLALVVALLLALHSGEPTPAHILFFVLLGALLAAATRWPVGLATIVVLLTGAIVVRLAISDRIGSDVLAVTRAAIDRVLAGLDPYGYAYPSSTPPGAPFPYGPLAILLYMPFHHAASVLELVSSTAVLGILAVQGRLIGLAVYAAAPILVAISVDGSNDTTLGLLILAAFMTARRWPMLAGFILALATGFKLSALAFVPGFLAWAGLRVALVFAAGSVIAWAPVVVNWGIANYLDSVDKANIIHANRTNWSLGVLVKAVTGSRQPVMDVLKYVFGAVIAVAGLRFRKSLDGVILVGIAAYVLVLYGGNWGSYAYFGGIAPIVCWRLDDWLGFTSVPLLGRLRAVRDARARKRSHARVTHA
jgi:Glycosyltransferase family 87